jgi:hypothetical protein
MQQKVPNGRYTSKNWENDMFFTVSGRKMSGQHVTLGTIYEGGEADVILSESDVLDVLRLNPNYSIIDNIRDELGSRQVTLCSLKIDDPSTAKKLEQLKIGENSLMQLAAQRSFDEKCQKSLEEQLESLRSQIGYLQHQNTMLVEILSKLFIAAPEYQRIR